MCPESDIVKAIEIPRISGIFIARNKLHSYIYMNRGPIEEVEGKLRSRRSTTVSLQK